MSVLVLIKNMRIPTSCSWCDFCGYYGHTEHMCDITKQSVDHEEGLRKRLDDCPLIEAEEVSE